MSGNIVEINRLSISFPTIGGVINAVSDVSLAIRTGKTLGIVGESGCGKSVLASSILRLSPKSARTTGSIRLLENGSEVDILKLPEKSARLRALRGGDISMIFQEPMRALFPLKSIGKQLGEAITLHVTRDPARIKKLSVELLHSVGIQQPEQRLNQYQHEFSGGMCQRVMIAIALAASPRLLIADEPTTALDVTIQAQVLKLIRIKQRELGMAVLFISHDMGVIMEMAEEIAVMYLGRIVEKASAEELFTNPLHPYTRKLLKAIPTISGTRDRRLATIEGSVPIPLNLKPCCGFHNRCEHAVMGFCDSRVPELLEARPNHWVSCFLAEQGHKEGGA